jgi:ubiquinone/menaquinone biosynthesis C-methylase UbiE
MNPGQIAKQYDRIGRDYIASRDKFIDEHGERPSKKWMYNAIPDVSGKVVLDVGCGDGVALRRYAEQGASWVTGIDSSQFMVDAASRKLEEAGLNNVYVERLGADEDWKYFLDSKIDIATSSFVLHYVGDLDRVFENAARVLKPGGVFVYTADNHEGVKDLRETIVDPATGEEFSSFELFGDRVRVFIPVHTRADYDSETFRKYFEVVDTFEGPFEGVRDVPADRITIFGVKAVRRGE